MKEFRVYQYYDMDDNYNELWKVINPKPNNPKYFCRHVFGAQGTWYYVCDPLGYCELDYPVPDDVIFIVCKDSKGEELFRNSNADVPFPTFKEVAREAWVKAKKNLPQVVEEDLDLDFWMEAMYGETTQKKNIWLLSFKDPELYGDHARDYDENWIYCRVEEMGWSKLEIKFQYLGKYYAFYKVHYKHTICGVEWVEYHLSTDYHGREMNSLGYFGSYFDINKTGRMLTKRAAIKLVSDALKEIYPSGGLSQIKDSHGYVRETKYGTNEAAELLIGRDYSRENIQRVIENERKNRNFYEKSEKEKKNKDWPGYHPDYSLGKWF